MQFKDIALTKEKIDYEVDEPSSVATFVSSPS